MGSIKLIIPPKRLITKTNAADPVFFHYYPGVGYFYRRRLKNTLELIRGYRFRKLLEVGYGSGIFLPTLSKLAKKVVALDIHKETNAVKRLLDYYQTRNVDLISSDLMKMPFANNTFDACVAVSVLEDIPCSERAVTELGRVVKPGGHLFISFPVKNFITDSFFRLVGENPDKIHPSDHRLIINFLKKYFRIERMIIYPRFLPLDFSLYISVHCVNTSTKAKR